MGCKCWQSCLLGAARRRQTSGSRRFQCPCTRVLRCLNRLDAMVEQRVLQLRQELRRRILGEYGAEAIQQALEIETGAHAASRAGINRVLARHGLQDGVRRSRRPAPPRGWYLPALAAGQCELDSFDLIEDLKIEDGPLASILTGTSLQGGWVDAWPLGEATAKLVLPHLQERWEREGL